MHSVAAGEAVCRDPHYTTWQTPRRGAGTRAVGLGGTAGKPWVPQKPVHQHGANHRTARGTAPVPGPIVGSVYIIVAIKSILSG